MREILSLERGERRYFDSSATSWLGLVISGDVSGSDGCFEIVWPLDGETQKAVLLNSPTSVTCRSQRATLVWFEDYDVSNHGLDEVHQNTFACGQIISLGLTRILLLELRPGGSVKQFHSETRMEGFVIRGQIHIGAQTYDSPIGGLMQIQRHAEGKSFCFNGTIQLKLECQGQEEALAFLIWETENPLADISSI